MRTNKKILILANINKFGGTRTYLKNIINYYQKHNWQIFIATENQLEVEKLLKQIKTPDIKVIKLSSFYRFLSPLLFIKINLLFIFQYINVLKVVNKINPDLVFISPVAPTLYLSTCLLKQRKIIAVHTYPRANPPIIFKYILMHKNSQSSKFVTVSKYSQKMIKKYWKVNSKVIYNHAETDKLKQIKTSEKNDYKYILTSGHLIWYKNPITWINTAEEVFRLNPNFPYQFIWLGDGGLRQEVQDKINKKKLNNKCKILSPTESIQDTFKNTYIYFQPSLLESQGISVTNAIYLGIPCIVSDIGGLPEVVKNNQSGYVIDKYDYRKMAEKIIYLHKHNDVYQEMSSEAKDQSKKFTLKEWTNKMDKVNEI